ncbi:transposase [Nannocystis sp. ILAH1]|uniref:IS66 family transposase n=1 Tax=Nannocystis sp. ILAH1 TaxID=2996789 RepID=UPI00226FCDFD|nr:transposase [Nannocystis sp. ILAH1]
MVLQHVENAPEHVGFDVTTDPEHHAPDLELDEDAGRVRAEVGLREGIGEHRLDERLDEVGELLVPAADRRARELEAVAGVERLEAVRGQVVLPAMDDRVGEEAGAGEAALDRQLQALRDLHRWRLGCRRRSNASSEPELAKHALSLIKALFRIERALATAPRKKRESVRQAKSKPLVDAFFLWCDQQAALALDGTPLARALGYARNQRIALQRFLGDGRLPLENNISERNLRREVIGRKNWLFLGSEEGARANTLFVSLLASCQLHRIEPWAYIRDLLCLLPSWPRRRALELAPAFWHETLKQEDTQQRLATNVFRRVSLGMHTIEV